MNGFPRGPMTTVEYGFQVPEGERFSEGEGIATETGGRRAAAALLGESAVAGALVIEGEYVAVRLPAPLPMCLRCGAGVPDEGQALHT